MYEKPKDKYELVRSPDPQPREVSFGKSSVNPPVSFRYTIGYSLLYGLIVFLALPTEDFMIPGIPDFQTLQCWAFRARYH